MTVITELRPAALHESWTLRELLLVDQLDPNWRDRAVCVGLPAHLFFPEEALAAETHRTAVEICAGCPVRIDCRQAAIERGETHGIWGGESFDPQYRRRHGLKSVAKRPDVARCGTDAGYHRHRRLHEDACDPCKAAHRLAESDRRHNRRIDALDPMR